ncbi:MAG: amino acid ABC transporter ATP-binding protein [Waddliaceae bacterium]|jgi:polar amino acid transport system ATP-binding protein|nr:amino acid ABC transporter ATP-binding protein [Waddliaceae bacterium]MBT3578469.1 amino acid ABC transporter ATP-binding protein [Waddliaceae bacterium]MBT4444951.1 amino acid ABC transporter ATP-binding protein [Waddliaceae bacterium]MBT6927995.1 amino acid ABC transporter ATP-binding protein [Waddliaceae bacterium]MBT7263889.1 amino acid ABC transporter ATP-binding protein [Waddliaceae bacterium]
MLQIKGVSKAYGKKVVLDDITMSVAPGDIALMMGGSGTGKSTLLRVLCNLESVDAGVITLDGVAVDTFHDHTVGMVFQQFHLFDHLSALRNITLALEKVLHTPKNDADTIAHALLEKYGLADKASCIPSQLSGGQKQRLAIARAVALKPRVICMDEPTSALDPSLTATIATTIEELAAEGYIVVVASHDTALVEKLHCTVHLMEDGKIVESALSQEIASAPQIQAFVSH